MTRNLDVSLSLISPHPLVMLSDSAYPTLRCIIGMPHLSFLQLVKVIRASSVGRPVLPATVTAGCREPGVRVNALATRPATERVPSKELPLSAIFSSLT